MTNREKLIEVLKDTFGFIPENYVPDKESKYRTLGACPEGLECDGNCDKCPFNKEFWDKEYKPCFVLKGADDGKA